MGLTNLLLIGTTGQVGKAWISLAKEKSIALTALSRNDLDLMRPESTASVLDLKVPSPPQTQAQAVVLAAAYTQVDLAEKEQEAALNVNARSVGEIAKWCARQNIPLIHYSTDYVYSGEGHLQRTESEPTQPLNHYGASKLEGENRIRESGARHFIFRTSWVYDSEGKNFFKTMHRLAETNPTLRIVGDQIGAPTYAPHLVRASYQALVNSIEREKQPVSGISKPSSLSSPSGLWGTYHLCAPGETSWHGFASEIFLKMSRERQAFKMPQLISIRTSEYPTPAKRPLNSRLDLTRSRLVLDIDFDRLLPHWTAGLDDCILASLKNL